MWLKEKEENGREWKLKEGFIAMEPREQDVSKYVLNETRSTLAYYDFDTRGH